MNENTAIGDVCSLKDAMSLYFDGFLLSSKSSLFDNELNRSSSNSTNNSSINTVINGFSNIDFDVPAKILPFRVTLRAIGSI